MVPTLPDITLSRKADLQALSDGDLALLFKEIGKALENHPAFKGDLPPWAPNSNRFYEHEDVLVGLISLCMRDRTKEPEKMAARKRGCQSIDFALQIAHMYSVHHNDPSAQDILGSPAKEKKYNRSNKLPPGKLQKLEIQEVKEENGHDTDRLLIRVARIPDKGSVEIQYTDNPNDPASCKTLCHLHECRSFVEKGELHRVKKYYFRGRYDTAGGKGPWSDFVPHVIL